MNCPKCGREISQNDFYCKKCGKVLKIQCPQCNTINTSSICSYCKLKLLIKCNKCAYVNHGYSLKCKKCSEPLELEHGKIYDYPIVSIEFCNFEEISSKLKNEKFFIQFKENLFNLIKEEASKLNITAGKQKENLITFKFNRSGIIKDSSLFAIDFSVKIASLVNTVSNRLNNIENIELKTRIGVAVSNLFDRRESARIEKSISILDTVSVIVNPQIYKYSREKYKFEPPIEASIREQTKTYYQLQANLTAIGAKITDNDSLTSFLEFIDYFKNSSELEFSLKKRKAVSVTETSFPIFLELLLLKSNKPYIINIIGERYFQTLEDISVSELKLKFQTQKWFEIYCNENYKFYPFGLFRNMIRTYLGFEEYGQDIVKEENTIRSKLSALLGKDTKELEGLLLLNISIKRNIDELRDKLFSQIEDFFVKVAEQDNIVFVVKDFENIDRGSFDCFKTLLKNKIIGERLSFIISTTPEFRLSEILLDLNGLDNYYEVTVKPDLKDNIIRYLEARIDNFREGYNFNKIVENSKGSIFFIDQYIKLLEENNVLIRTSDKLSLAEGKSVPALKTIEEIIKERINILINNPKIGDLFIELILLGPVIPLYNIKGLQAKTINNRFKTLEDMGLIDFRDKDTITIKNYNLLKKFILSLVSKDKISAISEKICRIFGDNEEFIHPAFAEYLELSGNKEEALKMWKSLMNLYLLLGDVSAFERSSEIFLRLFEEIYTKKSSKIRISEDQVRLVKLDIYEQIARLCYEYYPELVVKYLRELILAAESHNLPDKIVKLSGLMVQAGISTGNNIDTFNYIGKIIANTPKGYFDIKSSNFNIKFYLINSIKAQILFNIGKLDECIFLCEHILTVLGIFKQNKSFPKDFSPVIIDKTIKDIEFLRIKAKILLLSPKLEPEFKNLSSKYKESSDFVDLLWLGYKAISGVTPGIIEKLNHYNELELEDEAKLIYAVNRIICCAQLGEWEKMANIAYSSYRLAEKSREYQIVNLLWLAIGYFYKVKGSNKKAKAIYQKVIEDSIDKDILNVLLLGLCLLAELEYSNNDLKLAFEIINKANMLIEKNPTISRIGMVFVKQILAKIYIGQNDFEKAEKAAELALNLSIKYGLLFNRVICSKMLSQLYNRHLLGKNNMNNAAKLNEFKENIGKLADDISKIVKYLNNPYLIDVR